MNMIWQDNVFNYVKIFIFFSLKFDSLTLKTHFISLWRVSKMHFSCPFCGCQNEGPASCKWWSGGTGLLQMVIWSGRPLANDDPEGPASCRWSSGGAGLLQMMIRRDRPLADGHPEGPASCKWWYGGTGLLQMVIRRDRPLANDHPEGSNSKRSNWGFQWLHENWLFLA